MLTGRRRGYVRIPELARHFRVIRRQKVRSDGRPLTLADIQAALKIPMATLSGLENRGDLPHRAETLLDYITYLGLDLNGLVREFTALRTAYEVVDGDDSERQSNTRKSA